MGHGKGTGEASGEGTGKGNGIECPTDYKTARQYCGLRETSRAQPFSICCLSVICVTALAGLGIAKIVMGAVYLHECSLQYMIPIFLIVSGVVPILFGGSANRNTEESKSIARICGVIGFLFSIAWTIAGSVWVYPTWGMVKTEGYIPCAANATNCKSCNEVVLTFAFAMVTIDWVYLGILITFVSCSISAKLIK